MALGKIGVGPRGISDPSAGVLKDTNAVLVAYGNGTPDLKAVLADMIAAQEENQELIDTANTLLRQANAAVDTANAATAAIGAEQLAHAARVQDEVMQLAVERRQLIDRIAFEKSVSDQRTGLLDQREANVTAKEVEQAVTETEQNAKQRDLADLERNLTERKAVLDEAEASHQRQLADLQDVINRNLVNG